MNVLHKGMQGFYSKFKYWNFRKTLEIDQSNPVSRYICIQKRKEIAKTKPKLH